MASERGLRALSDTIEVCATPSLTGVAAAEWDTLAATGGLYTSHAWLSSAEREPGADVEYLLARRRGRLVGSLAVYDVEVEHNPFYEQQRHANLLSVEGSWTMAGARRGYRFELPAAPGEARGVEEHGGESATVDALLTAALERAELRGERGCLFPFVTTDTARLLWKRGAGVALDSAEAAIVTDGAPFEDYVGNLTSKRRIAVRHEFSTFRAAGYELGLEKLEDCYEEAAPLLGQLQRKYGHEAHDEGMREYLAGQIEMLGKYSKVFTARRSGRLVGFSLMYEFGDVLYARAVGFDYARTGKAFEYYALCYYLPIEYMHQQGLKVLHLGMGTYQAKVARGARLSPLWSVALPLASSSSSSSSSSPEVAPADTFDWLRRFGSIAVPAEEWQPPWAADWQHAGADGPSSRGRGAR